ncbi:MAG: sensor histidine kinase [Oligoflexales bacterium]
MEEKDDTIEQQKSKIFYSAKLASIGEMAGGVAHEINNPLAIISGNTYKLERYIKDNPNKEKCNDAISKINQMIIRITKIVDGLRYLSHEQSDKDGRLVEVKKIVDSTLNLCQEKFNSMGINVQVNIPSDFKIYCREVQISQVLLNLLNNAFEAAKKAENPIIKLEVIMRDNYAEFSVINSGVQISDAIANKIFDPFFTTRVLGKGTGLGLSISKGIANSHQGDLFLDRNRELTTFTMRIPIISKNNNEKIAV